MEQCYWLNYRLHSTFITFSTNILFSVPGSNSGFYTEFSCQISSVFSNLWQFLSPGLSFMILTLLKSTGQLFCIISLNLGLSDVFLLLDWRYGPLAGTPQKWVPFQCIILEGDDVNMSCYWWRNLHHLKWYLPGFSSIKLLFSPL